MTLGITRKICTCPGVGISPGSVTCSAYFNLSPRNTVRNGTCPQTIRWWRRTARLLARHCQKHLGWGAGWGPRHRDGGKTNTSRTRGNGRENHNGNQVAGEEKRARHPPRHSGLCLTRATGRAELNAAKPAMGSLRSGRLTAGSAGCFVPHGVPTPMKVFLRS